MFIVHLSNRNLKWIFLLVIPLHWYSYTVVPGRWLTSQSYKYILAVSFSISCKDTHPQSLRLPNQFVWYPLSQNNALTVTQLTSERGGQWTPQKFKTLELIKLCCELKNQRGYSRMNIDSWEYIFWVRFPSNLMVKITILSLFITQKTITC